jgi:chaperone required for assembly of F1-ATPase
VVTITGSLVLALALLKGAADADAVWQAAHVDALVASPDLNENDAGLIPAPPRTALPRRTRAAWPPAFRLAALSPVVTITGSLVLALALLKGAADADAVWQSTVASGWGWCMMPVTSVKRTS